MTSTATLPRDETTDAEGNTGFCHCCRQDTFFERRGAWLRDQYVCAQCGSIPRQRHVVHVLDRLFPDWRALTIHESSPTVKFLAQWCPGYSSSQLLEGVTPGSHVNGVQCENLERLTFASDSLDLFVTQDVLEHVFEPEQALREIMRVLRPGGAHVFTTPKHAGLRLSKPRARMQAGRLVYLEEPQYHGNPVGNGRSLVTWDYGDDFEALVWQWCGYATTTFVTRDARLGLDGEYLEVFVTRKLGSVTPARDIPAVSESALIRYGRRVRRLVRHAARARHLPGRLRARLLVSAPSREAPAKPAPTVVFDPCAISALPGPVGVTSDGRKGRLLCVTHVVPYPPRAGNEYRIHRMLSWLAMHGWDILLVVCPPPGEVPTDNQIAKLAEQYPNLVVCQRDGALQHRLRGGGTDLEALRGRQPRTFAPLLHESRDGRLGALEAATQVICPDALVELMLHLEAAARPHVVLAEYVFMTRVLPLLRTDLMKVVDTHDVFSTRSEKVKRFGVDDGLTLDSQAEAEALGRADVLIAIQPGEAEDLRRLAPDKQIVTVGVDFAVSEDAQRPPADSRTVLLVASRNPMNVKGLEDFLRFAWPLVLAAVPDAELHVIGTVGEAVEPVLPRVRLLGKVEDLARAYAAARVVINPSVAGTGLKIKTLEALACLRPIVVWPSGVDGLNSELRELCHVATSWFDFAEHVIGLALDDGSLRFMIEQRTQLVREFAPDVVYAPLGAVLDHALSEVRS